MKIFTFLFMAFICCHIISQNNDPSFSFSYELTEDIKKQEENKYLKARDYLKQDSIFEGKSIYFSAYLADLDYFYLKDVIDADSVLKNKLFFKNKWFEDYYSSRLDSTMGKQCGSHDYIAFFSLVENDMLRVDIFPKRIDVSSLRFDDVSLFSGGGTQSYLFDFEKKSDKIRKVLRIGIIYD